MSRTIRMFGMGQRAIRRWYLVHKWTSIVVTGFLLLLCVTGLPLIFHHELDAVALSDTAPAHVEARLDAIVDRAMAEKPGWLMRFLSWDEHTPLIYAVLAPTLDAEDDALAVLPFDRRTGARVTAASPNEGVMHFLLELHASLLLGMGGTLFLSAIGLVFLISLGSGVVVYAPFMRRLAFGTVRKDRSARLKWLDTHNLAGIVLTGWLLLVGATGCVLCLSQPIQAFWQRDQLAEIAAPYGERAPVVNAASLERALAAVRARGPEAEVSFIAWPRTRFSTAYHYMIALKGNTPITQHTFNVAMVDASTAELSALRESPWYVKALFLSAPLHFGDYGGLPLKLLWALLDLGAIVVLATGLYLWLGRRRASVATRLAELAGGGAPGVGA